MTNSISIMPPFLLPLPVEKMTVDFCAILVSLALHMVIAIILRKAPSLHSDDKKIPIYHGAVAVSVSIMLLSFGWSMSFLKGVLLVLVMLYAAVSDIQTHHVSDCVSVMLLLIGVIDVSTKSLLALFASGCFVGGLMLACAVLTKNRIGGADVKIAAASAFLLGVWRCAAGLIVGLLLSVVINTAMKNKKRAVPLVPYLAVGFTAAYTLL